MHDRSEHLSPTIGATMSSVLPAWLNTTGYDPEDGLLPSQAFSWSSDRDGALGSGDDLLVDGLSTGWHEITLTASDSEDNATEESVSFYVDPLPPRPCYGDCGGDAMVTVNEVITAVNVALGNVEANTCPRADADGDGSVTVDELLKAVNAALSGCTA